MFQVRKNSQLLVLIFLGAVLGSAMTLGVHALFTKESPVIRYISSSEGIPSVRTDYPGAMSNTPDFTGIVEKVVPAVVSIKAKVEVDGSESMLNPFDMFGDDFYKEFFGQKRKPSDPKPEMRTGQGSGVIISPDGYIVTNNHVVDKAVDLEVLLSDNRIYTAKVIGTDPSTDLALIKIAEKDLPTLPLVNSDEVRVGEWVLAVGNPMNLDFTVTAGIVSAKGRSIGILRNKDNSQIESFIQTDAAINPGNSGGALVNLQGGLVGINTAIATQTGYYNGYGFAVPSQLVSKVVEDLLKYGMVQRGYLGVIIREVDGNLAKAESLNVNNGVLVDSMLENSAAAASGVMKGDVIVAINDIKVGSTAELQELIARRRPGDKVTLTVDRKGAKKQIDVTLNNRDGKSQLSEKEPSVAILDRLGVELENVSAEKAKSLAIEGGVRVKSVNSGVIMRSTRVKEGFIITKINDKPVKSVDEVIEMLSDKKGSVMFEGIYESDPDDTFYYGFGL